MLAIKYFNEVLYGYLRSSKNALVLPNHPGRLFQKIITESFFSPPNGAIGAIQTYSDIIRNGFSKESYEKYVREGTEIPHAPQHMTNEGQLY